MAKIQYSIEIEAATEEKAKEIGNAFYTILKRASDKEDIIFLAKKVNANPELIAQAKKFLGN
ncbi:MAG: hypothetical protein WC223_12505 [Bacteroidales bacterium]|jgi:hypothetical protein